MKRIMALILLAALALCLLPASAVMAESGGEGSVLPSSGDTAEKWFGAVAPKVSAARAEIRARASEDGKLDLRFVFAVKFNDSFINYKGAAYGPTAANGTGYEITDCRCVLSSGMAEVTVPGSNILAMYEDAEGEENSNYFIYTAVLVGVSEQNFDAVVSATPQITYISATSQNPTPVTVTGNTIESSINGALNG